jgi:plastocyanin
MMFRGPLPLGRRLVLGALAGLLVLALGACGSSGATTTGDTPAAADNCGGPAVTIQDLAYTPQTLPVAVGATVTWVWRDGAIAHDVDGDGFASRVMANGSFRHASPSPAPTSMSAPCIPP